MIVVINGPRNEKLEQVCDTYPGVDWMWTAMPGKRNAIDEGLASAPARSSCSSTATRSGPPARCPSW